MILLINPNSTVSMTDAMLDTARQTVPSAQFEGWTNHDGPPSIQGRADGDLATSPLLDLIDKACELTPRAIIIACFDDTALAQARARANCPVIGIGQAAYHLASLAGQRFSVVTTLPVSVPILEENVHAYGLGKSLSKIRASDVPVLALEQDPDAATEQVIAEILKAEQQDNIQSVVLGCGGMVGIEARARARTKIRMIDGVRAAAHICAAL